MRLSAGCIAAAGTLAALIPPSILMVIYGVITEQSIGKLLIAGIVPGIVTAFLYCGGIYVLARWRPDLAPLAKISVTWGERLRSLYGVSGVMVLFVIVVGGIYGGYFPATYAGAVGAFGAFVIAFAKRRLSSASSGGLKDAAVTTSADLHHRGRQDCSRASSLLRAGDDDLHGAARSAPASTPTWSVCGAIFTILGCFVEPIAIMVADHAP